MKALARNLLSALFWGLIWHILAICVDKPLLLPQPLQVLERLGTLCLTAEFWRITAHSLGRVLLGIGISVLLGTLLGVLCAKQALADALIAPLLRAIQASPVASFSVLVLVWVERDLVPVLICVLMATPVVHSSVCTGVRNVDPGLLELGRAFRLPGLRVLRRIYLPGVLPYFRTGCLNAVGLGWKAGVAAEVLTVPLLSVGRQISQAKTYLETVDLFAWTLAVILLSIGVQKLVGLALSGRDQNA